MKNHPEPVDSPAIGGWPSRLVPGGVFAGIFVGYNPDGFTAGSAVSCTASSGSLTWRSAANAR